MIAVEFKREEDAFAEHFPDTAAVYAVVTEGEPHLGKTAHLRRRMTKLLGVPEPGALSAGSHARLPVSLREIAREVRYLPVASEFEADWELYRLSRELLPLSYRKYLRLRIPVCVKLNLSNPYPRVYLVRGIGPAPSIYLGPFRSRVVAERFANDALDFFRIRRCVENLAPDPAFPGCVYSEMKMCLAPCFRGCSDEQYAAEVDRVRNFLLSRGASLDQELTSTRQRASEALEFEAASAAHQRLEKLHPLLRGLPNIIQPVEQTLRVVIVRADTDAADSGAYGGSVNLFTCRAGMLSGPHRFSLAAMDESGEHTPLEPRIKSFLESVFAATPARNRRTANEHLALLARWYYRGRRRGELVTWKADETAPLRRFARACGRVLSGDSKPTTSADANTGSATRLKILE